MTLLCKWKWFLSVLMKCRSHDFVEKSCLHTSCSQLCSERLVSVGPPLLRRWSLTRTQQHLTNNAVILHSSNLSSGNKISCHDNYGTLNVEAFSTRSLRGITHLIAPPINSSHSESITVLSRRSFWFITWDDIESVGNWFRNTVLEFKSHWPGAALVGASVDGASVK